MTVATPLSTDGRFIVDANGLRVRLAGVNWIGAHMDDGVVAGLDRVHRSALAETIASLGFNCVRFPFSVWMTQQTSPVPDRFLTPTWGRGKRTDFAAMYTTTGNLIHQAGQIALLWAGEFSTNTRSLANFGLAAASAPGEARNAAWWRNMQAWLTANDVDWCWWGLNATHAKGTNPVTGKVAFSWGNRATDGLLTDDWRGVASPAIMEMLQSMMRPRTGPGISQ